MVLEEYKDTVATFAGIVTIAQIFSGVFVCKTIYEEGSTRNIPGAQFIGGFVISILFLQHGIILEDAALGIVNFTAIAIHVFYLLFYYAWSNAEVKTLFRKQFLKGLAVIMFLVGYAQWENPGKVAFRFGMIVTVLMMTLIASPLFSLKKIIATKNTDSLPFPMILSGTVVASSWLLYGIIIKNDFLIFQNLIGLTLSVIQLSLFVFYPKKPVQKKE